MRIVVLGLSLSSSWGNGHATTYRALLKALARRGHEVLFLERDRPWYAENRDLVEPDYCGLALYGSLDELDDRHRGVVAAADAVLVGSYVPEGTAVGAWAQDVATGVTAFYDIDTPITVASLALGASDYLTPELIPGYDLYLSFTGGPLLQHLVRRYGARLVRPLYCAVDPEVHGPEHRSERYALSYLGTYSADRQPGLERLLIGPARAAPDMRFAVAGPQYPSDIPWPANVERIEHLDPSRHGDFYAASRFTLNLTRAAMAAAGYSPSVRLFEAAACGTPIISDWWEGLDAFLEPGREIVVSTSTEGVLGVLRGWKSGARDALAAAAARRVASEHLADHRAVALEGYIAEAADLRRSHPLRETPSEERRHGA
ncbi:MAG: glycosyltransferase [Alphaproteobacteria bacterium]